MWRRTALQLLRPVSARALNTRAIPASSAKRHRLVIRPCAVRVLSFITRAHALRRTAAAAAGARSRSSQSTASSAWTRSRRAAVARTENEAVAARRAAAAATRRRCSASPSSRPQKTARATATCSAAASAAPASSSKTRIPAAPNSPASAVVPASSLSRRAIHTSPHLAFHMRASASQIHTTRTRTRRALTWCCRSPTSRTRARSSTGYAARPSLT